MGEKGQQWDVWMMATLNSTSPALLELLDWCDTGLLHLHLFLIFVDVGLGPLVASLRFSVGIQATI